MMPIVPIGAEHYSRRDLPVGHAKALMQAFRDLADEFMEDLARLLAGGADFSSTSMASYLPGK